MEKIIELIMETMNNIFSFIMETFHRVFSFIMETSHNIFSFIMEISHSLFSFSLIQGTFYNNFSLNSIWSSLGITDLRFLSFLQIIFFIIFIFLNIVLLYIEYLNKNSKKTGNSEYLQSGPVSSEIVPHIRRYSTYFIAGISALSGIITLKNEYVTSTNTQKAIEEYRQNIAKATKEIENIENKRVTENMHSRSNMEGVDRSVNEILQIKTARSKLRQLIDEAIEKYEKTGEKF